jgi:probable HAF family extracellular repeat protein
MAWLSSVLEIIRGSAARRKGGRRAFIHNWSARRPVLEGLEDRCLLSYSITDLGEYLIRSVSNGINAFGNVAGFAYTTESITSYHHAFFYDGSTMTDLTPGFLNSQANSINDYDQLVGSCRSDSGEVHAFLFYGDGTTVDLGTLGGTWSEATGINNSGEVVGSSRTYSRDTHAFLSASDASWMYDLGTLGGANSRADAINNFSQIVGGADGADGNARAFWYSSDVGMIDLGTLGGTQSEATAINDFGQVAGWSRTYGDAAGHAFLFDSSLQQMFDIGTLGGVTSSANGINNFGQVVGQSSDAGGNPRAFLYSDGNMLDLNSLLPAGTPWTLWSASSINDAGQIVGYGVGPNGIHGYLLTPDGQELPARPPSHSSALDAGLTQLLVAPPSQQGFGDHAGLTGSLSSGGIDSLSNVGAALLNTISQPAKLGPTSVAASSENQIPTASRPLEQQPESYGDASDFFLAPLPVSFSSQGNYPG